MRNAVLGLALMFTAASITGTVAQQRKKNTEKQSDQQSPPTSGHQRCEGGLFMLEDGVGPQCQRRDGKICQVRGGTSGQAFLADCK